MRARAQAYRHWLVLIAVVILCFAVSGCGQSASPAVPAEQDGELKPVAMASATSTPTPAPAESLAGQPEQVTLLEIANIPDLPGLNRVVWSPDGKHLAAMEMTAVHVWEFAFDSAQSKASWKEIRTLAVESNSRSNRALAWSPDGSLLAVGLIDGAWLSDATTGKTVRDLGLTYGVRSFSWSPDGSIMATSSSDGKVRLWHTANRQEPHILTEVKDTIREVAWSPDGSTLASTEAKIVRLWDAASGQELRALRGHTDLVGHVAWSPDSTRLATTSDDRTVRIWDAATGQELHRLAHDSYASCVAWSPDGALLASSSGDGKVYLWTAADGKNLLTQGGYPDPIQDLSWSPDGVMLASASDNFTGGTLRVWAMSAAQPALVAWSVAATLPDGRHFISDGSLLLETRYVKTASIPTRTIEANVVEQLFASPTTHEFGFADLIVHGPTGHYLSPKDAALNKQYIGYLKTLPEHTGFRFYANGPTDPILIYDGGKIIGVLMPLKLK